jgi:Lysozyme inhibitor LprI
MSGPSRFAAFILVATLPAHAEIDFRRDPHAADDLALISSCIDVATSWETVRDCVGEIGKICKERMQTEPSRVDEGRCLWRDRDLWQDIYAREALLKETWTLQKDLQMHGVIDRRPIDAHATFERMEANWQTYLEAQCDYEMLHWGGGTIVATDRPYCEIALIAERIFWIRGVQRMDVHGLQE